MSKYLNKKMTVDNIKFDSKKEAQYYIFLKSLYKAGKIKKLILQPEFELQPKYRKNGRTIRAIKYIADFHVVYEDGSEEIIDVKGGFMTKEYKIKKKMFEYKYPHMEIKEV